MKIDVTVTKCENPGVVFAISAALKAAGFNVIGCGFGVGPLAGTVDLHCEPPIDFADSIPEPILGFAMGQEMIGIEAPPGTKIEGTKAGEPK